MAADTSKPINLTRLVEVINKAFEGYWSAQQALQKQVQESVLGFVRESFHDASMELPPLVDFSEMAVLPKRPELTLQRQEEEYNLSSESSGSLEAQCDAVARCDEVETVLDRQPQSERCGPRAVPKLRAVRQPLLTSSGVVWEANEFFHRDIDPDETKRFDRGASRRELKFDDDMSDKKSVVSSQFGSTKEDCLFLSCTGGFARVQSIHELPAWHRLAEKILQSDPTRLPALHDVWAQALDANEVDLGDVVQACKKANFLATLTKSYRQISNRRASLNYRRRGFRRSLEATYYWWIFCVYTFGHTAKGALPFHPSGRVRSLWNAASLIVCLYDLILLPMIAFDFGEQVEELKDRLNVYTSAFWTIDIVLSFLTAYFDGYAIVKDLAKISVTYARSWLLFDLSLVLNDWLSMLVNASYAAAGVSTSTLRVLKSTLRCIRLIRLWKISSQVTNLTKMLKSEVLLTILKIATYTFVVFIICHYFACGFYALHSIQGVPTSWVEKFHFSDATATFAYFTCLHWALTQLLPASMQVYPVNMPERIFNIAFIIVAMVLAAFYTSSIIVSMNHLRSVKSAAIERDNQLRLFLSQYDVSDDVAGYIWGFMTQRTRGTASKVKPSDVIAFKGMPEHILEKVYSEAFLPRLNVHPLLEFYGKLEPRCMMKLARTGVEQLTLTSGGILYHDLMPNRMLFVIRGLLIYDDEALDYEIMVHPGEWCCEEVLWGRKPHISVPFYAGVTGCELFMVNPEAFHTIAKSYAKDRNSFMFLGKYADEFIRRFVVASHDSECKDILFNDFHGADGLLRCVLNMMQTRASVTDEDSDDD